MCEHNLEVGDRVRTVNMPSEDLRDLGQEPSESVGVVVDIIEDSVPLSDNSIEKAVIETESGDEKKVATSYVGEEINSEDGGVTIQILEDKDGDDEDDDDDTHECEECGDEFDSEHGLAVHEGMTHGDEDEDCGNCGAPADASDVVTGEPLCKDCAQSGAEILMTDGGQEVDHPTEVSRDQLQRITVDLPDPVEFDRIVEWDWGTVVGEVDLDDEFVVEVRIDHDVPYAARKTEPTHGSDSATIVWERDGATAADYPAKTIPHYARLARELTASELRDYLAVEIYGYTQTDWAEAVDLQRSNVSERVNSARRKLGEKD